MAKKSTVNVLLYSTAKTDKVVAKIVDGVVSIFDRNRAKKSTRYKDVEKDVVFKKKEGDERGHDMLVVDRNTGENSSIDSEKGERIVKNKEGKFIVIAKDREAIIDRKTHTEAKVNKDGECVMKVDTGCAYTRKKSTKAKQQVKGEKGKKPSKLSFMKYDWVTRTHVLFKEKKLVYKAK